MATQPCTVVPREASLVVRDSSGAEQYLQCDASGALIVTGGGGGGGGTVAQGTAAAANAPWPVQLSDGTSAYVGCKTAQLPAALGQAAMAASLSVALASNQSAIPVTATPATTAAAADAVANPTLEQKGVFASAFNGTTWDRIRSGIVGVQTTFTGILNALGMARYNATAPTLADGNIAPLQATSTGALRIGRVDAETVSFDLSTNPGNAASTTVAGTAVTGLSDLTALTIAATLAGSTGGVLDVYIQHSPDGGTTWFDYCHFTQLTAAQAAATTVYVPAINDKATTPVGKGTAGSPGVALAANTFVGGKPFDQMRLVTVTGSGVSASVPQTVKIYGTRDKH